MLIKPMVLILLISPTLMLLGMMYYLYINDWSSDTWQILGPTLFATITLVVLLLSMKEQNYSEKKKVTVGLFSTTAGNELTSLYRDFADNISIFNRNELNGLQLGTFDSSNFQNNYSQQYKITYERFIKDKIHLDENGIPPKGKIDLQVQIDFFIKTYISWLSQNYFESWDMTSETTELLYGSGGSKYTNEKTDEERIKNVTKIDLKGLFPKNMFWQDHDATVIPFP
jgi:hypothetical protein